MASTSAVAAGWIASKSKKGHNKVGTIASGGARLGGPGARCCTEGVETSQCKGFDRKMDHKTRVSDVEPREPGKSLRFKREQQVRRLKRAQEGYHRKMVVSSSRRNVWERCAANLSVRPAALPSRTQSSRLGRRGERCSW